MPQQKGFQAFVEEHDAIFTILGAAIVFAGFVMKDGFREANKDIAALLTAAQFNTDIQETLARISKDVGELRRPQLEAENKFQLGIKDPRITHMVDDLDYRVAQSGVSRGYLLSTFQMAHSTFEHLPEQTLSLVILDARASVLIQQLSQSTPDVSGAQLRLLVELTRHGHSKQETLAMAEAANERATKAISTYEDLESRCFEVIPGFKDQVIQEIERQHQRAENRLRLATWGSYCLFTTGWFLGVIGKLWKISAFSEASEG